MSTLRITEPSTDNKYYIHVNYGGYNKCLLISGKSCLPNCVGYCWGAWYEMMGKAPSLSRSNAKNWYGYTSDGYARGKSPKLGAVACWGGGQYGHVAIVVGVFTDYIVVAQSNYGGNRWEKVRCYKYGNGYKSHGGNTNFQGFIYLPSEYAVKTESSSTTTGTSGKVTTWNLSSKYKNGKKFTTKCALNMRSYPSTSGAIVECVSANHDLYYYGRGAKNGNICWYWVHDYSTGKEGYVYGGVYNSGVAPYLKNANP